jgi:trans-aconitate methyltransferase
MKFPAIDFHIYGMDHPNFDLPENMKLYGWVESHVFEKAVKEIPIFLRLTEHDGFSVAVIEALGYGAEVMMSLPSDLTVLATTNEEACEAMERMIQKVEASGLKPNKETIELVKERFNRERIVKAYLNKLKEIIGK